MGVFPENITLGEVKEAVKGMKEFVVKEDEAAGYAAVNYHFCHAMTFPDPGEEEIDPAEARRRAVLRECRGLLFDLDTGAVCARRYHKFFNVGENEECSLEKIDTSEGYTLLNKLDGQLASPFMTRSGLRWGTKMGLTPCGSIEKAFTDHRPNYGRFARKWLAEGVTPLFEWCSPNARIIIPHDEDRLVLTAMRHNASGRYFSHAAVADAAREHGIDVVEPLAVGVVDVDEDETGDLGRVVARVKAQSGTEGCVMVLPSGRMYKLKTEWYFALTRKQKSQGKIFDILKEHQVWEAVLTGVLDDYMNLVPRDRQGRLREYNALLQTKVMEVSTAALDGYNAHMAVFASKGRKDFAASVVKDYGREGAGVTGRLLRSLALSAKAPSPHSFAAELREALVPAILRLVKTSGSADLPLPIIPWSEFMFLSDEACLVHTS